MIYRYTLSRKRLAGRRKGGSGSRVPPAQSKGHGVRKSRRPGYLVRFFRFTERVLVAVLVVVSSGLVVWGGRIAMESEVFKLEEVHASGFEHLQEAEVLKGLRPPSGTSLFDIDLTQMEERLLSRPWIKEVNLRKVYPNALSIHVLERHPVFLLMDRDVAAIVDETGAIIEVRPREGNAGSNFLLTWAGLPVMRGITVRSLQMREARAHQRFMTALMLLREAPFADYEDMDLDISRPEDLRVRRQGYLLRFGSEGFAEKWRRFISVENEIKRQKRGKREIDLRFPYQVIVRGKV